MTKRLSMARHGICNRKENRHGKTGSNFIGAYAWKRRHNGVRTRIAASPSIPTMATPTLWKENGGVKAMTRNKVRAKIVNEYTVGKVQVASARNDVAAYIAKSAVANFYITDFSVQNYGFGNTNRSGISEGCLSEISNLPGLENMASVYAKIIFQPLPDTLQTVSFKTVCFFVALAQVSSVSANVKQSNKKAASRRLIRGGGLKRCG